MQVNYFYYTFIALISLGFLAIVLNGMRSNRITSAYSRVNNCVLSIAPANRTQDDVEDCHKAVQEDTGITLKRYDK